MARIMKNALPENAKIAKEAKECMQECVSEFISFITSEGKLQPLSLLVSLTPTITHSPLSLLSSGPPRLPLSLLPGRA